MDGMSIVQPELLHKRATERTMYHDHIHTLSTGFLPLQRLRFHFPRLVIHPSSSPLPFGRQLFRVKLHILAVLDVNAIGRSVQWEEDPSAGCDDVWVIVQCLFGRPGGD